MKIYYAGKQVLSHG